MRLVALLVFVALVGFCICKENTKQKWKKFKLQFNKTYETNREDHIRFKIFKENIRNIHKHNKRYNRGKETYLQEINRFGDLTNNEFIQIYGLSKNKYVQKYTDDDTPTTDMKSSQSDDNYLDWRDAGAVIPAKDQGKCGSCWIFSAIGALESYNFRKTGKLISFSEQNVVDCYSNNTCDGGMPFLAVKYVLHHGVYFESDYPYTAGQDQCRNLSKDPYRIDFNTTYFTGGTDNILKQNVKKYGPMSICLYVSDNWRFYSKGVWYNEKCSPMSNHCVLLVGYGRENDNDYWLFKNSWGPNWGQDGFIKVARNKHANYCGIGYGTIIAEKKFFEYEANEI